MPQVTLENCIWLGGSGYPIEPGVSCHVVFGSQAITVWASKEATFQVPLIETCSIEISGPGNVTRGGGFVGGGFGVEGAIEGMAVATLLNALTTKTKIHTFVLLTTNIGEFHLHYSGMEPSALRIALAHTFTALRRQDPHWQRSRIAVLDAELDAKQISGEDFERLKSRILLEPPESMHKNSAPQVSEMALGPLGCCPNCRASIPLKSEECPKCKAIFTANSTWKVVPL